MECNGWRCDNLWPHSWLALLTACAMMLSFMGLAPVRPSMSEATMVDRSTSPCASCFGGGGATRRVYGRIGAE